MRTRTSIKVFAVVAVMGGLAALAFFTRERWTGWIRTDRWEATASEERRPPIQAATTLRLTPQARANLKLISKPITLQSYWRTLQVPGAIVDRPGRTDRGVSAPAVGVVAEVHAYPGDAVRPGDKLFTLRLSSEYLQNTQSELFKATQEVQLLKEQYARLEAVAQSEALPRVKLIELDNQIRRQTAAIKAHRQDLLARGLTAAQVDEAALGRFVSTIDVFAPPPAAQSPRKSDVKPATAFIDSPGDELAYEVQELKIDLGQQVQAGQLLCYLANHNALYIEGHAFKQEAPFLEQAAQHGWPIQVEFAEDDSQRWPPKEQTFQIHHLANAVDRTTRTFAFFIKLANQSRTYEKDGATFVFWRFRPGQRVRLQAPVEQYRDVIVLPAAAVVREGPEAYVFRQNGDLFDRRPVHVLHEDRRNIVLANDGSVAPGSYLAQSAAASLNRVLKAQAASGAPAGVHVHADGTTHGAH